jgi:hypothetical protein
VAACTRTPLSEAEGGVRRRMMGQAAHRPGSRLTCQLHLAPIELLATRRLLLSE